MKIKFKEEHDFSIDLWKAEHTELIQIIINDNLQLVQITIQIVVDIEYPISTNYFVIVVVIQSFFTLLIIYKTSLELLP